MVLGIIKISSGNIIKKERILIMVIRNGIIVVIIFSILISAILHPTNKLSPTGGVQRPIARFTTSKTPK